LENRLELGPSRGAIDMYGCNWQRIYSGLINMRILQWTGFLERRELHIFAILRCLEMGVHNNIFERN